MNDHRNNLLIPSTSGMYQKGQLERLGLQIQDAEEEPNRKPKATSRNRGLFITKI